MTTSVRLCTAAALAEAVVLAAVRTACPHVGDIVIHRHVHSPAVYVLGVLDRPLQQVCGGDVRIAGRTSP
jgi:hypothetical protein